MISSQGLSYRESGSGFPIILIHGFCESKEIWKDHEEKLSQNYRVICPDLPGFGESPLKKKEITIEYFAEKNITPTSMIDVSDGLSSETLHICKQSELGCIIYEDKIPVYEEARQFAYKLELDPTACALSGGEDYELLFTIAQDDYEVIKSNDQISVIGYMTDPAEGTHILTRGGNKHALVAQGWNHME